MIKDLIDTIKGKKPLAAKRSGGWSKARKEHLLRYPTCAVCSGTESLEVHHKEPFHINPELELSPSNMITLCESKKNGANCHLLFGHLGDYRCVNKDVVEDSTIWRGKISNRG